MPSPHFYLAMALTDDKVKEAHRAARSRAHDTDRPSFIKRVRDAAGRLTRK